MKIEAMVTRTRTYGKAATEIVLEIEGCCPEIPLGSRISLEIPVSFDNCMVQGVGLSPVLGALSVPNDCCCPNPVDLVPIREHGATIVFGVPESDFIMRKFQDSLMFYGMAECLPPDSGPSAPSAPFMPQEVSAETISETKSSTDEAQETSWRDRSQLFW